MPIGRGRAAIPNAILKSLKETGVTFLNYQKKSIQDHLKQIKIPLTKNIDATQLYEETIKAHILLIRYSIKEIMENNAKFIPQDESKATFGKEKAYRW